eukprot:TRINITY_DN71609_c0_g2_i1.p1 TRINITY_DN71609_c0_g2~~TRINITY_DN71609_c0_g2_i1.p1  ORF type:complete len:270 (-),score=43.32 TRINITY_DN71609_c0_g2_i1:143-952(-)
MLRLLCIALSCFTGWSVRVTKHAAVSLAAETETANKTGTASATGCAAVCDTYPPSWKCALEECAACADCGGGGAASEDCDRPAPKVGSGVCSDLYREEQVGLKCGKHALQSVVKNLGLGSACEAELDDISALVGAPSQGSDYDLAVLWSALDKRGLPAATAVSNSYGTKSVKGLLSEFGQVDPEEVEKYTKSHGKAWVEKHLKKVEVSTDSLSWLICNPGGHWKTYFKQGETWCNLDSVPARNGQPARSMTATQLDKIKCKAIVIPSAK